MLVEILIAKLMTHMAAPGMPNETPAAIGVSCCRSCVSLVVS